MKKFVLMLAVFALVTGLAIAAEYQVEGVSGRVEMETAPGKMETIRAGTTLNDATVVNIGLKSVLKVKTGDRVIELQMGRGQLGNLITRSTAAGSVSRAGDAAQVQGAGINRGTANISTASTRASEAVQDQDFAE